MKKYYSISPMNEVSYIGEFEEFKDAWDFVDYESNIRFAWIISENSMKKLNEQFQPILNQNA